MSLDWGWSGVSLPHSQSDNVTFDFLNLSGKST